MGLGGADLLDDGEGRNGGGKVMAAAISVACSICLDAVLDDGDRSWAKLQCGHQFHLDCIGSAFNSKGSMQCPNCRKIEKGQWLYANGNRSMPEFNMDDWTHDEDMHDLSYSEMSFGMHWCPFSGLTRLPTFEEGEFSSNGYHDLLGHHTIFAAEHTPMSSATHPCPYVTYFGPVHPSSASSGSVSDGSIFSNLWNGPSVPSEVPSSYDFRSIDAHYHNWEQSPFATSSRIATADQPSIPSVNQRALRNSSDMPRQGMLPFIVGHSSTSRAPPTSVNSSNLPPYPGAVSQPRDRAPPVQPYLQHSNINPPRTQFASTGRRSSTHRGLASDQPNGYYFFSSNSSGRAFQEPENAHYDRFWEREHQPSSPLHQADQDSIWGPFHPPGGGSDAGRSSGFRSRHSRS